MRDLVAEIDDLPADGAIEVDQQIQVAAWALFAATLALLSCLPLPRAAERLVAATGVDSGRDAAAAGAAAAGTLTAPMPGAIVAVLVEEGQAVTKGERLVVLEAMKTQQPFLAPTDGTVKSVPVSVGQQVSEGQVLVVVEP